MGIFFIHFMEIPLYKRSCGKHFEKPIGINEFNSFFCSSKNTTWSYNCWGLTVRFHRNNGMGFQFAYFLKKVFAVSISMPSPFHAYNFDLSSQNNNFLHCFLIVLFIFCQLNKNVKSNWIALYRCQLASQHGSHSF